MKKLYLYTFLFVLSACSYFQKEKQNTIPLSFDKVYKASISDEPLVLQLHSDSGNIEGNFISEDILQRSKKMKVKGEIHDTGTVILNAFNRRGNKVGIMKGETDSLNELKLRFKKPIGEEAKEELTFKVTQKSYDDLKTEIQNRIIRNNHSKFITVDNSSYHYQNIGGISNLDISVRNKTKYSIDNIEVVVEYIKTNGRTYKTEKIYFDNIPPKGSKEKSAPNSTRGTKIDYYINSMYSDELNFCYSKEKEEQSTYKDKDPFFCER